MDNKIDIKSLNLEELTGFCEKWLEGISCKTGISVAARKAGGYF